MYPIGNLPRWLHFFHSTHFHGTRSTSIASQYCEDLLQISIYSYKLIFITHEHKKKILLVRFFFSNVGAKKNFHYGSRFAKKKVFISHSHCTNHTSKILLYQMNLITVRFIAWNHRFITIQSSRFDHTNQHFCRTQTPSKSTFYCAEMLCCRESM